MSLFLNSPRLPKYGIKPEYIKAKNLRKSTLFSNQNHCNNNKKLERILTTYRQRVNFSHR
jgi:hypothetical protein